jgi:hypothetical protein
MRSLADSSDSIGRDVEVTIERQYSVTEAAAGMTASGIEELGTNSNFRTSQMPADRTKISYRASIAAWAGEARMAADGRVKMDVIGEAIEAFGPAASRRITDIRFITDSIIRYIPVTGSITVIRL